VANGKRFIAYEMINIKRLKKKQSHKVLNAIAGRKANSTKYLKKALIRNLFISPTSLFRK